MKILVLADIHGEFEKMSEALYSINHKYDVVVCPGDFTDMFNIPQGFSQMNVADIILQKTLSLKKPFLCVPGNHDPYEILDLFDEYKVNLHNKVRKINGIDFLGWGGAPTPFNTLFEPTDEETKESLEKLGSQVKSNFVLVLHNPPKDTKLDLISSGKHVGSPITREFILKKKPLLAISAHIHEARGVDKLGSTTLFYPGEFTEGYYGIATIEGHSVKCEIHNINK